MHVVIDLGEMHSYLACWEMGKSLEDACIKVKLPGVAAYKSTVGNSSWEREILREYFSFIYREYLVPSRMIIESAALTIPSIYDLNIRRLLLDVLEEVFGLYEATIIPHPIALVAGIQMNLSQLPLFGDVLVIEERESSYSFAFVSIIDPIGITLEKQFSGDISNILAEADRHAYHSAQGWHLDHILLAGNPASNPATAAFIASLPPDLNVICRDDLDFTAAEGLSARCIDKNMVPRTPFNIIYPYEFYLGENESTVLDRIWFDTANLELNCEGRYRIISLNHPSIDTLAADEKWVRFRIYELETADGPHFQNPSHLPVPVLEIDSPHKDLPTQFELYLDMASATIQLDLITESLDETPHAPKFVEKRFLANQHKLHQILSRNGQNEALLEDWTKFLHTLSDNDPSLSDQIDHTLFHLYGLLQLWQSR